MGLNFKALEEARKRSSEEQAAKFKAEVSQACAERDKKAEAFGKVLQKVAVMENESRRKAMEQEQEKAAQDAREAIRSREEQASVEVWNESAGARSLREFVKEHNRG